MKRINKIAEKFPILMGLISLIFVLVLLVCTILLLIFKKDDIVYSDQIIRTATISSVDYNPTYVYYNRVYTGKTFTLIPITKPAEYLINVTYDYVTYSIDDETAYNYAKNHIGEQIDAIFHVNHYESGKDEIVLIDILNE